MHHFRGIQEGCRCYDFIYLLHCLGFFDLWISKQHSNKDSLSFFLALVSLPMDGSDLSWFSQSVTDKKKHDSTLSLVEFITYFCFARSQFPRPPSALHSLHLEFQAECVPCGPGEGKALRRVSLSHFAWLSLSPLAKGPDPCPQSGQVLPCWGLCLGLQAKGGSSAIAPASS